MFPEIIDEEDDANPNIKRFSISKIWKIFASFFPVRY